MAVYIIITYDIHDTETFKPYPALVRPLLKKHGVRVIAMETNPKALEGTAKMMNTIMEFSSAEAVDNFYNDPDYQAIIHLRLNSTSNGSIIMLNKL
jgi:uncharacterized protein (DUF1330 family)